jgi:hypothetical protein
MLQVPVRHTQRNCVTALKPLVVASKTKGDATQDACSHDGDPLLSHPSPSFFSIILTPMF